ncbi:MAG: GatB/YqeY domain-containing protein [Elainellaceae cyanobacterium]
MPLKDQISEDIKSAMKAKDKIRLETVRSIKKVLLEKESDIRGKGRDTLSESEEFDVLVQQAKQRRDSIEQYRNANRDDLADKEAEELAIIETYLPQQLTEDELSAIVDVAIAKTGASSPKDMGKVMGPVMQQTKGLADGKAVQAMVKAKLSA